MVAPLLHHGVGWRITSASRMAALWLCIGMLVVSGALAQDAAPPAPPTTPDLATLAADIKFRLTETERLGFADALDTLAAVEEPQRIVVRETLNAILADLKGIDAANASMTDLDQRIANAPILLEQIKSELAQPPASVDPPTDQTVQQLEQGMALVDAELRAAKEDAANLDAEAKQRTQMREEIPTVIARSRQEMQGVDDEIAGRTTLAANDPVSRVDLLRLIVHRRSLEQAIALLDKQQQSIDARRDSLRARQDRAARRVTQAQSRADVWRQKLNEAREAEARRIAAEAKQALRQSANEHEVIKALLRERTDLAGRHETLVGEYQAAQKERQSLEAELQSIRVKFLRSFEEIDRTGLTNAVGIILGLRRNELPNVRMHLQQMRRRQQRLSEALGEQFQYERRRDEIVDTGASVKRIMDSLEPSVPQPALGAIGDRAREELTAVSDLLNKIILTTGDMSEEISKADSAERALVKTTQEYAGFIDERILWVRSTSALTWNDLKVAGVDLTRLGDRSLWERTAAAIREGVQRDSFAYLPLVPPTLAWLLLVLSSWRISRVRKHLAEELHRDRLRPSFRPTLKAMLLVLLSSLRWPLVPLLVSMVLSASADTPAAIQSIVDALRSVSAVWLALEIGRQACRSGGFAEMHLRWPREAVNAVRHNLFWLGCFVVPADTLFRIVNSEGHELTSEPLARLTFIAGMMLLAGFIQRTLRPHGPILRSYYDPIRGGWLARLSGLWFLVLLCLPLFLAVLTGLGYFYSAKRLQESLSQTLLLGLLTVILSALFYRWLWVTRRRVAIERALKRHASAQEQADTAEGASGDAPTITEEEIDLPAANAQTLQLFRSATILAILLALWGIWSGVLPALGLLHQFELWPNFGPAKVVADLPESITSNEYIRRVESSSAQPPPTGGSGGAAVPAPTSAPATSLLTPDTDAFDSGSVDTSTPAHHVTIADLAMAIIIGVITLILTRNIPGLLEIAILQRLPLDAGSRYAVSTIVRYIIVIVGVMTTFGAVGIGWSQIQWLAAALTFGLAFGLQEIFANFISGLIILIERPMRVGDTVTIGDISGEVFRIRMRATTIMQWNMKELIVPNREFITSQLVNWSLSDSTLRIEIPVGIAYGSDTRLARSLLLKVANKCESVLKTPAPKALFRAFGESSLNFELRLYISGINNYADTIDSIHYGVDDEFRKAGIEMAFPQRDIHIRTIKGVLPIAKAPVEAGDEKGLV